MKIEDTYDRAWRHFDMIAKQRISTFNFYIVILGALVAATVTLWGNEEKKILLCGIAIAHMITAVSFMLIDRRIRGLLDLLKEAMCWIEKNKDWPIEFRPFTKDEKKKECVTHVLSSYTVVFRVIHWTHIAIGFALLTSLVCGYIHVEEIEGKTISPQAQLRIEQAP